MFDFGERPEADLGNRQTPHFTRIERCETHREADPAKENRATSQLGMLFSERPILVVFSCLLLFAVTLLSMTMIIMIIDLFFDLGLGS